MTGEQWMLTAEALTRATKRARIAEEKLEATKSWHKAQVEVYSYTRDASQGKTREYASISLRDLGRLGKILEADAE